MKKTTFFLLLALAAVVVVALLIHFGKIDNPFAADENKSLTSEATEHIQGHEAPNTEHIEGHAPASE